MSKNIATSSISWTPGRNENEKTHEPPSRFRISPERLREIAKAPKTKKIAAQARTRTRLRELAEDPETRRDLDLARAGAQSRGRQWAEPEEIMQVIAKHWRRRYDEEMPGP